VNVRELRKALKSMPKDANVTFNGESCDGCEIVDDIESVTYDPRQGVVLNMIEEWAPFKDELGLIQFIQPQGCRLPPVPEITLEEAEKASGVY
jgi:hypothetical protein